MDYDGCAESIIHCDKATWLLSEDRQKRKHTGISQGEHIVYLTFEGNQIFIQLFYRRR